MAEWVEKTANIKDNESDEDDDGEFDFESNKNIAINKELFPYKFCRI